MRVISFVPTFRAWQKAARGALNAGWSPDSVLWEELGGDQPGLDLGSGEEVTVASSASLWRVPKAFVEIARRAACHRDEARWALLYRVLWRLTHDEPRLLEIVVDADVHRLMEMDKSIRRDVHKMRAFVRFREVTHEGEKWYVAWFEPEHHIVELNAPFFTDRFAQMHWSILTPDRCLHWDGKSLTVTAGVLRSEAPETDNAEQLWLTYYSHIFNPARVKTAAMVKEMPKKYWKNLPEAAVIPDLLEQAPKRVQKMIERSRSQEPAVPVARTLSGLKDEAAGCQACPLYRSATQTVFGEGPAHAPLLFVGEQPGDSEDLAGRPFVGPAGQLLDRALAEVGIDRSLAYVTNAVKHFKFEPRGKTRLHKKPSAGEVTACRPWLVAEMELVRPAIIICLGGTAAHSVFQIPVKVLQERGRWKTSEFCPRTLVTFHPSALLRAPDEAARDRDYQLFLDDLRLVKKELKQLTPQ